MDETDEIVKLIGGVAVDLVEHEGDGYAVGFGRGEEAVDEGGGGLGIVDRDDQDALVEIGRYDMRLLGEVGGTADDVVPAVFNLGNEGGAFGVGGDGDTVANGYGVGAADALESEITLDFAFYFLTAVGLDHVPAAGVLYN